MQAQTDRDQLRATYKAGWVGVIKLGKRIIWECGHIHRNRDMTTSAGVAACDCSGKVLQAYLNPEAAQKSANLVFAYHNPYRDTSWMRAQHAAECEHWKWAIQEAEKLRQTLES